MNTPIPSIVPVPFHGANLLVVEHAGEPYVPMRPVVEGMGLAWASQFVKLNANKERWGVSIIETPSSGGEQRAVCLPLRKLPGWLMSIHPNKVRRPELRERIVQYQTECDDVLWQHWLQGRPQPSPTERLDAQCQHQLEALLAQHSSRFLVWFEGGQFQGLRPLRPTECVIDDARFADWWRECGSLTHPDLALVPVKALRVLEAAMRTALVVADINLADLNALLAGANLRPKPRPEASAG